MKFGFNSFGGGFSRILARKKLLCLLLIAVICFAALADFFTLGLARRTFVFYNLNSGREVVEERMLRITPSREADVARYVQEALLGPFAHDLLPLFPREARLHTLLLRDGVVYADFSQEAVFPLEEGREVIYNFRTLRDGIFRNFPFVREVRFFIGGRAVHLG
ncbi:MAG: GerMN domain-containing protein [Spirochaetes bacterium]|nr:GerMN domain-containing protein [Spirochaetota bacterium]